MYKAFTWAALLCCGQVSALPTYFIGDATFLNKTDFNTIKQLYRIENGVEKFAEVAYELELETYGAYGVDKMNFDVSGTIQSAWYSSNFAMTFSLYCEDTLIAQDTYEGIRYERNSYVVKPSVSLSNYPINGQCNRLKLRLDKQGNLYRKFVTRIEDIQIRLYLTRDF